MNAKDLEKLSNDDWDVTCSIYADLVKQEHMSFSNYNDDDTPPWKTHVEIPVSVGRFTFMRQLSADTFRVWALPPQQSSLPWRLTFSYNSKDAEALPKSVHIEPVFELPHSWKHEDELDGWKTWLQQEVSHRLKEEEMSYAVCNWLENHALDYWNIVLRNEEGFGLLLLNDRGPTHYDITTVVMSFPGPRLVQHSTNGRTKQVTLSQVMQANAKNRIHPMVLERSAWQPQACPICLEPYLVSQMEQISCGHYVCLDCFTSFVTFKVEEIQTYRENPFRCPLDTCRQGLTINGCVKKYLTPTQMVCVRDWIKDIKHPRCYSLPDCLSVRCKGRKSMRKLSIDSALIYCDVCQKRWCEWCLKRLRRDETHTNDECDASQVIRFCQRYLAAGAKARDRCLEKYPWMKLYAPSRMDRDGAEAWLKQNDGQQCPVCKSGVERVAGCFRKGGL